MDGDKTLFLLPWQEGRRAREFENLGRKIKGRIIESFPLKNISLVIESNL